MNFQLLSFKSVLLTAAIGFASIQSAGAATIGLANSGSSVVGSNVGVTTSVIGSTFSVDLLGLGLPADFLGGGFFIAFDPAVVSLTSGTPNATYFENFEFNAGVTGDSLCTSCTSGLGEVVPMTKITATTPAGDLLLTTLTFTVNALSNSMVSIYADTGLWQAYDGAFNTVTFNNVGTIAVSAVPIPPAIWLLGSALMGLVGLSRRKAQAKLA